MALLDFRKPACFEEIKKKVIEISKCKYEYIDSILDIERCSFKFPYSKQTFWYYVGTYNTGFLVAKEGEKVAGLRAVDGE